MPYQNQKNSNNIIEVYANSKISKLGLGDYVRIASFLPNLKKYKINWYANKELFPILKRIDFINKVYNIEKKKIKNNLKSINLFENGINTKNNFYINNLLVKNKDIKKDTLDLYKKLASFFKIKKYKIYTNKKKIIKKDIDVFFNWCAPLKWKKKQFPKKKWKKLEKYLYQNKKVVWQNPNDNLDKYINKISRSKFVISIIGFGNHISTLFNIPTVILCGPTFFNEAKKHKEVSLIFPNYPCGNKSCKVIKYLGHCGRTEHIKVSDVIKKIKL